MFSAAATASLHWSWSWKIFLKRIKAYGIKDRNLIKSLRGVVITITITSIVFWFLYTGEGSAPSYQLVNTILSSYLRIVPIVIAVLAVIISYFSSKSNDIQSFLYFVERGDVVLSVFLHISSVGVLFSFMLLVTSDLYSSYQSIGYIVVFLLFLVISSLVYIPIIIYQSTEKASRYSIPLRKAKDGATEYMTEEHMKNHIRSISQARSPENVTVTSEKPPWDDQAHKFTVSDLNLLNKFLIDFRFRKAGSAFLQNDFLSHIHFKVSFGDRSLDPNDPIIYYRCSTDVALEMDFQEELSKVIVGRNLNTLGHDYQEYYEGIRNMINNISECIDNDNVYGVSKHLEDVENLERDLGRMKEVWREEREDVYHIDRAPIELGLIDVFKESLEDDPYNEEIPSTIIRYMYICLSSTLEFSDYEASLSLVRTYSKFVGIIKDSSASNEEELLSEIQKHAEILEQIYFTDDYEIEHRRKKQLLEDIHILSDKSSEDN
ncbi:hypothetical protein [Candidatus Halobonum tyrrellensis]|uniref:hypothetical protein n=1 Tax=Candidatus Halobonum tyrrellensis TaxID=1431545 RepID=UPI001268C5B3|nr:hypothetical protein [Candidatus Halobonum tyrrellensis]